MNENLRVDSMSPMIRRPRTLDGPGMARVAVAAMLWFGIPASARSPLPPEPDEKPAETGNVTQPAAPSADFSEGFKQLAALGLPALGKDSQWHPMRLAADPDGSMRDYVRSLKGHAWFTPAPDGKFSAVGLGGIASISEVPKPPSATPLDPAEDADRLIAAIRKAVKNKENEDPFADHGSSHQRNITPLVHALLFATQLHQTGRTDAANRLAAEVFSRVPDSSTLIDGAVAKIADADYSRVTEEFFASADWTAYQAALRALLEKFPRGWENAPAVRMVADAVAKRVNSPTPPSPKPDGVEISPAAAALVAAFADFRSKPQEKPTGGGFGRRHPAYDGGEDYGPGNDGLTSVHDLWLLGDPDQSSQNEDEEKPKPTGETPDPAGKNANPARQLTALGIDALPALASLIGEPYLTHTPNHPNGSGYYNASDSSPEERVLSAYQDLNRPLSLSEIACKLIASTLPNPESEDLTADPDALRDQALAFWKEHRQASREQLALVFLTQGSSQQISLAAPMLVKSTAPDILQALESHMLEAEEPAQKLDLVRSYLKQRRDAAKPFLAAYVKLLRDEVANPDGDSYDDYVIKQSGGIDKLVKSLETLTGGLSPRAQAVEIAKGNAKDAKPAITNLLGSISDLSNTKQLYTLLEGAAAAKNAEVRAMFLAPILQLPWPGTDRTPDDATPLPPDRVIPPAELRVWKKLLADTRPIPKDSTMQQLQLQDPCVAELAAAAFELSVSPGLYVKSISAATVFEQPFSSVLRQRANARATGGPLPPLPDADQVTWERLKEIVANVAKLPTDQVRPHLGSLTPNERAAWMRWFFSQSDDLPQPENLRKLNLVIVQRSKESGFFPDTPGLGGIEPGFVLSADSLLAPVQSMAADLPRQSRSVIYLMPLPFPPGMQVYAFTAPLPEKTTAAADGDATSEPKSDARSFFHSRSAKPSNADQDASADGWIEVFCGSAHHRWKVVAGKAVSDGPAELQAWQEQIQSFTTTDPQPRLFVRIQAISAADSRAIHADSENE